MRLRNQFVYYGAHTGRWSARAFQPHNLIRAESDQSTLRALVDKTTVESIEKLSTCIRPCVRAGEGKKLIVCDLSAIENRVLAWLSGCEAMLDIYRDGLDPYKAFAVELLSKEYDQVTKTERQICKPAVLGCGYGQGGGQERQLQNGQKVKTGLWRYAESMGVKLSQAEAQRMVRVFRNAYSEVVFYWGYLEDAFLAAYRTRKRQQVGAVYFTATKEAVKIELPSGRCIHYLNPHAWRGSDGLHLSFDGLRKGGWGRQSVWGGVLTENIVQAVARDVLTVGMERAEAAGFPVVLHVHDELVVEVESGTFTSATDLEHLMSAPIDWAPGLPLAAEGFEGEFYEKR